MCDKKAMYRLKPSTVAVSMVLGSMFINPVFAEDDETLVVTGTRSEQVLEKVPVNLEVITAQDIEEMGATSVADVLGRSAGVLSTQGGINIRGLGSNYSIILIDGRKSGSMENSKDFQGYLTESLNIQSIERIEILRGQAGSMYGSNAVGGVVNIITKESLEPASSFAITHGTFETLTTFRHDFGQQGNFFGMVGGSYKNYNSEESMDISDGSTSYSNEGDNYTLDAELGYIVNDSHKVKFVAGYQSQDAATPTVSYEYSDEEVSTSVSYRNYKRTISDAGFYFDGYTDDHTYSSGVTWNQVTLANNVGEADEYDDVYQSIVVDGENQWTINDSNSLFVGAEMLLDSFEREDIALEEDTVTRYAIYLQHELNMFDDKLLALPSMRLDSDSAYGEHFTYQLGLSYQVIPGHYLKSNYGIGYKAPTLTELYGYEGQSNGTVWGNADLTPEDSTSFDIRYQYAGNALSGSLGYYKSEVTDQITQVTCSDLSAGDDYYDQCQGLSDPVQGDENKLRINLPEVRMQGIEAELAYNFTKNLKVKATYTYLDGEEMDSDGNWSTYSSTSEEVYGADIAYFKPENGVGINAWGRYNIGNSSKDSDVLYDYYNVNLSVSKTLGSDCKVIFAGYNLIQSTRTETNDSSLGDLELRLSFQAKL